MRKAVKMALEKELETYKAKLPELKAEEGKFVLIHGTEIVRTFTSYEDAMKEAYSTWGPDEPFLVKQIQGIEKAHFISRFFEPCRISPSK
jgi:hypothetical protein